MKIQTIQITESERRASTIDMEKIELAKSAFLEQGAVKIANVFSSEDILRLKNYLESKFSYSLAHTNQPDRRPLFTLDIKGPIAKSSVITPPPIKAIATALLSENFILGACSFIASFPGAPQQFIHRDSNSLYDDYSFDCQLPPYALTVLIPLIDANLETGSTRIWPGTQKVASDEDAQKMPSETPEVAVEAPRGKQVTILD